MKTLKVERAKTYLEELHEVWNAKMKYSPEYKKFFSKTYNGLQFCANMKQLSTEYGMDKLKIMISIWFNHDEYRRDRLKATNMVSYFYTARKVLAVMAQEQMEDTK